MSIRICRFVTALFGVGVAAALVLFLVGTFGWFGQPRDPLSGVFLLPLGLPWNLVFGDLPDRALPVVAVGAPILNLLLLSAVCRWLR